MKFWESAEVSGNGRQFIKEFVRIVEQKINLELSKSILSVEFKDWDWTFIAIIMKDSNYLIDGIDKNYKEIIKKSNKNKVFEFRLRIPYAELKYSNTKSRIELYFFALKRCFNSDIQKKWNLPENDVKTIQNILKNVENEIIKKFES